MTKARDLGNLVSQGSVLADGTIQASEISGTLQVGSGGTGQTTLTTNNVLLGNGTSAIQTVAPGSSGNVLTSNGTTWVSQAPSGGGGGGGTSVYSNQYLLTGTTTNATETEIFVNGTANSRISVANNTNCFYSVEIVCRETGGGTNYGAFTVQSVAANRSGTVSDLGNLYEIIIARSSVNIAVDVRSDNTNKTVNLYVIGLSGVTLSWEAVVKTIEV